MIKHYYVNKNEQSNGDHEVHADGCSFMPVNKKYLGAFESCHDAVREAKKEYVKVDGCYYCANSCHKG